MDPALAAAPGLGDDQWPPFGCWPARAAACGPCLSPAGYGKTTMLHTAARAAAQTAGRSWRWPPRPRRWPSWRAPAWTPRRSPGCASTWPTGRWRRGRWWCWMRSPRPPPPRSRRSWPRWTPARAGRSGCWATPASPSRSGPAGSPTTSKPSPPPARSRGRLTVNRRQVDPADREALDLLRRRRPDRIPAAAGRAGMGARARQPGPDPPGHGPGRL